MSARAALRAATVDDHTRVDQLFSQLDLASDDDYLLFLKAQAAAHLPIEAALDAAGVAALLPDWPQRRRGELLAADLAELGAELPELIASPRIKGDASMWGALYVLEGSRLGGALLKRGLSDHAPCRFLAAPQQAGAWRKLLAKLEECLYEPVRVGEACDTARQVFRRFELSGRRYLEFAAQ